MDPNARRDTQWTTLSEHTSDGSLKEKAFAEASWAVDSRAQPYRAFRIRSTGTNSHGSSWNASRSVDCAGIELYGMLVNS